MEKVLTLRADCKSPPLDNRRIAPRAICYRLDHARCSQRAAWCAYDCAYLIGHHYPAPDCGPIGVAANTPGGLRGQFAVVATRQLRGGSLDAIHYGDRYDVERLVLRLIPWVACTLLGHFPMPMLDSGSELGVEALNGWHQISMWILLTLIGAHVVAALVHLSSTATGLCSECIPASYQLRAQSDADVALATGHFHGHRRVGHVARHGGHAGRIEQGPPKLPTAARPRKWSRP